MLKRLRRSVAQSLPEPLESRLLYTSVSAAALAAPLAPAGTSVSASRSTSAPAAKFLAVSAPVLTANVATIYITDAVDTFASTAETLVLTNSGTTDISIAPTAITFSGTNASQFLADIGKYPIVISAGETASIRVRMNAAKVGVQTATLTISSSDPAGPTIISVRGLGTASGTKGPTPQQTLDLYGIPVSVTRPSATLGGALKNETGYQLLTKAGPGPVTLQPIGLTASGAINGELMDFGWYSASTTPVTTTQLGVINSVDAVSVSPTSYGLGQFDPGGGAFGLFATWPGLAGHNSYSQDALNTWEPNLYAKRKIRFYTLLNADGSVAPNSYVMTIEAANGTATRTAVMIVSNVRHASLPQGWLSNDIGSAAAAGKSAETSGVYSISGGGTDIGGTADSFQYAYRTLHGDGQIVARVTKLDNTNSLARAGVMLRESLDAGARHATISVTPGGGVVFESRSATNGATTSVSTTGLATPYWVKIVRAGNVLTGYRSKDGVTWTKQGSVTLALGQDVLVGLAVTAHDNTKLAAGSFDNVAITPAAAEAPVAPVTLIPTGTASGIFPIRGMGGDAAVSALLLVDGSAVGTAISGGGPYSFTLDSRTLTDGDHSIAVQTTDRFGNVTADAETVTIANPDLPPIVRLLGASQGVQTGGVLNLSADATDERGVVGVTYLLDGVAVGPEVTTSPYAFSWNSAGLAPGWHDLTALARDTGGNTAASLVTKVWTPGGDAGSSPLTADITVSGRRREGEDFVDYAGQTIPQNLQLAQASRSKYGGDTAQRVAATGYFHTLKVNGRWWIVDPDGYLYFDNAVVAVTPKTFANNLAIFQSQFGTGTTGNKNWAKWVRGWLQDIGEYTAGPYGDPATQISAGAPMNYELELDMMSGFASSIGSTLPGIGHSLYSNDAMPVFDPRFAAYCNNYFSKVFPNKFPGLNPKADPYLVGYMTDNELPWQTSTLDNYLTLPAGDVNRTAAENWLAARGVTAPSDDDRAAFLSYVADTYFKVTSAAIRTYDPNHMDLGARFTAGDGVKPYLFAAAKPYIDVASVNYYDDLNPAAALAPAAEGADLPYMVTEMYAKGMDSGLPNHAGYGLTVRTQADRGAYYESNLLSILGGNYGVGAAWLSLMDNNVSNTAADSSNSDANKGLMPVTFPLTQSVNPYRALTDRVKDINTNVYAIIKSLAAGPPLAAPDLTDASDTGVSNQDNVTNNNTPTFTGVAPAGSAVSLYAGSQVVATGLADAVTGIYLLTTSTLADGAISMSVRALAAGGVTSFSAALPIIIDTVSPQAYIAPAVRPNPSATLDGFAVTFRDGSATGTLESVFGVTSANFSLTTGPSASLITGPLTIDSGATGVPANSVLAISGLAPYTVGNGSYTLSFAGGAVTDLAGNPVIAGAGSDQFSPPTVVTVAATDAAGSEVGGDPISFTLTRTGDLSAALPVAFDLEGAANLADDFGNTDTAVVIPAGAATATLTLTPIADGKVEGPELARFRILGGAGYIIGAASSADATVADGDVPLTAQITPVAPDPRTTPVDSVTAVFNRAVAGVDLSDFALTYNGAAVSLVGASITQIDPLTYQLTGLTTLTTAAGAYILRLKQGPATVQDLAGNNLSADATDTWQTQAVAPASTTIRSSADAFVKDGTFASTNFGTAATLEVRKSSIAGQQREAYLRFDLTKIAAASAIKSAKIRVYGKLSAAGSVPVALYSVASNTWTETGLKWSNKPTSATTALGTKTVAATSAAWYEFDVTAYLKQQKAAGAAAANFALKATAYTTPYVIVNSDEGTANQPVLVVT